LAADGRILVDDAILQTPLEDADRSGAIGAAALGHSSFATTAHHYARTEAVEGAQQERVLKKFTVVHEPKIEPPRAA